MASVKCWKRFESTGKVEDYLAYRSCLSEEEMQLQDARECQGVNPNAGIHNCDGNRVETSAYRGI